MVGLSSVGFIPIEALEQEKNAENTYIIQIAISSQYSVTSTVDHVQRSNELKRIKADYYVLYSKNN